MQDRSPRGFCVVGLAYGVVHMGSLRERGRPWGFVPGVRSHVHSHRAQEELCRRVGARCLAPVRMCDDLRSVWFCICVLCVSLRSPRGAIAVLSAFVGTGTAIEIVSWQRAIVEVLGNERENELSTFAFTEEYRAVTEGLRRLHMVNLVEKMPITVGSLITRLAHADWKAFRFIAAGVFIFSFFKFSKFSSFKLKFSNFQLF